jgi:hypothetical protein
MISYFVGMVLTRLPSTVVAPSISQMRTVPSSSRHRMSCIPSPVNS